MAQIEDRLFKSKSLWSAGGEQPTSADFMMMFPMEIMDGRTSEPTPQSILDYVKRIHERYASLALVLDEC